MATVHVPTSAHGQNSKPIRGELSPSYIDPGISFPLEQSSSIPKTASKEARDRLTYASFGHDDVTATASAYGHLLQITRYFGNEPSGFFCVDLPDISRPYHVKHRLEDLQGFSTDPTKGMRPLLNDDNGDIWTPNDKMPAINFLQDRWPLYITQTRAFNLQIHYFISNKTVYQTYLFTLKDNSPLPQQLPRLELNSKLLLRNLNFSQDDSENTRDADDPNYSSHLSRDERHSIIRMHKVQLAGQESRDAVALFMSLFLNGDLQEFTEAELDQSTGTSGHYKVDLNEEALNRLKADGRLEITMAYTLELVTSNSSSRMSRPTYSDYCFNLQKVLKAPYAAMRLTNDEHLNFILKRHLEHILSVCCIPIPNLSRDAVSAQNAPANRYEGPLIALTCGDISGHRIEPSASFHAFQYLLALLKYFQSIRESCACMSDKRTSCVSYECTMYSRIRLVCWGHLKWICHSYAQTNVLRLHQNTTCWVNGKPVGKSENNFRPPQFPLDDTLLPIIKATTFCQVTADRDMRRDIATDFKDIIKDFVSVLHYNKKNGEYLFPRLRDEVPQAFHSSDHAKIWWAIKFAEVEFGLDFHVKISSEGRHSRISYSSDRIKRSIHNNFTVENPSAPNTLFAVSRSLFGNQFSLGVDEIVLFYTMDFGLFDKTDAIEDRSGNWRNRIGAWKYTVDHQTQNGGNDYNSAQSRPLQLALAIILSANNKCTDSRTAESIYDTSKSALLASSSLNGLFPGQLDKDMQPELFDSLSTQGLFWRAMFEVPYILWKYGMSPLTERAEIAHSPEKSLHEIAQLTNKLLKRQDMTARALKSSTYEENIVKLSDEWLYHEPSFFNGPHCLSDNEITAFCIHNNSSAYGSVIKRAIENHLIPEGIRNVPEGYIIDLPKKHVSERTAALPLGQNIDQFENKIGGLISGRRTPLTAKKRFLHLRPLTLTTALTCYLASSEKEAISAFFDRHASFDRYFAEETTAELNRWVTELHLPFYRITKKDFSSKLYANVAHGIALPGGEKKDSSKWVSRTTMSFRFDGDLFDRFWTCHFIEYNSWKVNKERGIEFNIIKIASGKIDGAAHDGAWRQRKILELVLLDTMLDEMLEAANDILQNVKTNIEGQLRLDPDQSPSSDTDALISAFLNRFNLIDKLDNNTFLRLGHLWHELQRILQVVKDELNENLKTIQMWIDRDKTQERDKPRWTHNDERKYRKAITKLQTSNGDKIHELYRRIASITYFNTALTKKLENVRNERDYRGNNDIRLFTYVTVVFLPISFGTSLYSMSGSPSGQTVLHMSLTAIAALLVTTTALVNANLLDRALRPIFRAIGVPKLIHGAAKLGYWTVSYLVYLVARYLIFPWLLKPQSSEDSLRSIVKNSSPFKKRFGLINQLRPVLKAREDYEKAMEKARDGSLPGAGGTRQVV